MKWKGEYTKTVQTIYDLGHRIKWEMEQSSREKKTNHRKKKDKKEIEQKKKKNGKFPGTGSPSWLGPLSRYNALPTELRVWMESKF